MHKVVQCVKDQELQIQTSLRKEVELAKQIDEQTSHIDVMRSNHDKELKEKDDLITELRIKLINVNEKFETSERNLKRKMQICESFFEDFKKPC